MTAPFLAEPAPPPAPPPNVDYDWAPITPPGAEGIDTLGGWLVWGIRIFLFVMLLLSIAAVAWQAKHGDGHSKGAKVITVLGSMVGVGAAGGIAATFV